MSDRIDAIARILDHPLFDTIGPELSRGFELFENFDGVRNINRTVLFSVGSVAQFANTRVSRASIVPAIGRLFRKLVCGFIKLDLQFRVQGLEQGPEICGHNSGADQDDVRLGDVFHI